MDVEYWSSFDFLKSICVSCLTRASEIESDVIRTDFTPIVFISSSLDLQIDEKFATDDITIPFHSGAESYYKEKGINLNTQ